MAVINDFSEKSNIHPVHKKAVGERLTMLALAKAYGQNIVSSGPIYRSFKVNESKIIIYFDHAENGLVTTDNKLKGFMICGEDKKFVDAIAEIEGNTVAVHSREIQHPVAVRYGWANYTYANLFNNEGLPASPFRTDNFDI